MFRRIAVLLIFGCLTAFANPPATLLSEEQYIPDIATFLQISNWSPAGNSWDGKDVYVISSASGAAQVYRITESGWPYQLTTFPDGVEGFDLAHAGHVAVVSASVGGDENSQLYLMDSQTGRIKKLTDNPKVQYGSVVWAKDDSKIYYTSNEENGTDFFVYEMNITTGATSKVFDGVKGSNYIAELSHDGTIMIIGTYTSNVNNDLHQLDLKTGKWKTMTKDKGDVIYGSVTLMPDNKTVWLVCNDNKDGMMRVANMTLGSPKVNYVNDGWLDTRWECEGLGFSRDYKYMAASQNEDGWGRTFVREVETGKPVKLPKMDGFLRVSGFTSSGEMILSFSSPTKAPDVYRWNPQTEKLTQLTQSMYAGIDPSLFRDPALVHLPSFDGLEISGFLYLPASYQEGQPIPFIVEAHGGPESQFRPGFIRNYQYMMLNGYGVFALNPRGSSGYGSEFLALDNYKLRKNSLKDYKAATDWLIAQGYTAPGMIGIRGGSYGGYVTMGMITEYPDLYSAAVDVVGIVNFKSFLEKTADYRRALRESEYGPLSDPEFLEEISPINKADKIKTPLLVVHGENDPRVPVNEARQIIAELTRIGTPVDSLIFPDEGHGASKRVNIIAEYSKQVEFFNEHLKGEKATKEE
ncbi:MAG: S9 family peptidase [Calditrichaeota bacterium]|nr:S9 family peptidase [Calditrichota bacterium]MCB9368956.1 S9 family peptidase [Calditrichota bacterium]